MSMSRFRLNESPMYGVIPDPRSKSHAREKAVAMQSREDVRDEKCIVNFLVYRLCVLQRHPVRASPQVVPNVVA